VRFPFYIARRYLFSKRLPGAINLITTISVAGITIGTAALIVALSVFNGFHDLLRGLFENFDPDVRITLVQGKYIREDDSLYRILRTQPGVEHVTACLEGRAVLKYPDSEAEHIIQLKGVKDDFLKVSRVDKLIYSGEFKLRDKAGNYGLVTGQGVAYFTQMNLMSEERMQIFTVSERADLLSNPEEALRSVLAQPTGTFSLQKEYDDNIALVHIDLARQLFGTDDQVTAYELKLRNLDDVTTVQRELQAKLGPAYLIQTWYQQHQTLYEVMRNEKRVAFLVIAFMLLLASCNIVGSLTMIVLEKRRDIGILRTMGATERQIRRIFLFEGLLVGLLSASLGLLIGLAFCWAQQRYGLLSLGGGEVFIVKAYPVKVIPLDVVLVLLVVLSLAVAGSLYPAYRASRLTVSESIRS
jgi:lipoprotein-releasing system permease protein